MYKGWHLEHTAQCNNSRGLWEVLARSNLQQRAEGRSIIYRKEERTAIRRTSSLGRAYTIRKYLFDCCTNKLPDTRLRDKDFGPKEGYQKIDPQTTNSRNLGIAHLKEISISKLYTRGNEPEGLTQEY